MKPKATAKSKVSTGGQPSRRVLIISIAVFSFLLYINSIPNRYNLDDELVTLNNQFTSLGLKGIPVIFANPYYKDVAGNQYEYRPVTLTTFAIEHQFFGDNPHISHLINALLYTLLCIFFFMAMTELFKEYNYLLPFVATLLFISHPIHTEAVASIKNRDELLCFLGGILSFYYALLFFRQGGWKPFVLLVFFFVVAILSKKSILPFALLIPVGNMFFGRVIFSRLVLVALPLSAVSAVFWPFESIYQKFNFGLALFIVPLVIFVFAFKRDALSSVFTSALNLVRRIPAMLRSSSDGALADTTKVQWYLLPVSILCSVLFCYYDLKVLIILYLVFLSLLFLISTKEGRTGIFYNIIVYVAIFCHFAGLVYPVNSLFIIAFAIYFTGGKRLADIVSLVLVIIVSAALKIYEKKVLLITLAASPFICYFLYERTKKLVPEGIKYRSAGFFILSFILIISYNFIVHPDRTVRSELALNVSSDAKEAIHAADQVKVIPASGRELNFIEMPLRNSDPLSIRIGTSFTVLGKYLRLLIFPHRLGFYYGYAYVEPVPWQNAMSLLSIGIHLLLAASAVYLFKKHPVYSYGVFFYLACISAFSNLAAPVAGIMADRLAFVASAGFCIVAGYALLVLTKTDIKSPGYRLSLTGKKPLIILAVLVLYSVKTFSRNFQWKDHVTLMSHDIKHLDRSIQAHNLLGVHLVEKAFEVKEQQKKEKYLNEAVVHFRKAVELYPKADFAWHDLGQTYLLLNNNADALQAFSKALEIDPGYQNALMKSGQIYVEQKNFQQAEGYFQKWLSLDSMSLPAYTSLSQAYFMQKKFEKAIEINLLAVKKFPKNYDPVVNLGKTYFTMGDKANAVIYFEKAYALNPNDKNLAFTMATIYKEVGEKEKSDFYFSKANQIRP